jgi:hypothetical protein
MRMTNGVSMLAGLKRIGIALITRLLPSAGIRLPPPIPDRREDGASSHRFEPPHGRGSPAAALEPTQGRPGTDALVANPEWGCLFTEEERQAAAARLREKENEPGAQSRGP